MSKKSLIWKRSLKFPQKENIFMFLSPLISFCGNFTGSLWSCDFQGWFKFVFNLNSTSMQLSLVHSNFFKLASNWENINIYIYTYINLQWLTIETSSKITLIYLTTSLNNFWLKICFCFYDLILIKVILIFGTFNSIICCLLFLKKTVKTRKFDF